MKNALLRFRDTEPLSITKYSGIGTNSKIRVEELPSLPYNQYYWMYSLAVVEDRYVIVTGGRGRPLRSYQSHAFLLDVRASKWLTEP